MKKKIRILVDCGMVLLLPLLMAYSLVGETAHEYLGIGMFLLFVIHHILNIAWWKNLLRGKYTPIRIVGTVLNFVLVIIMLALPISGMILSRHVFRFLHFGGAATARTVHLMASYWGLVLMSFHAGMHVQMIAGRYLLNKKSNFKKYIFVLNVFFVVLGIIAFKRKNIWMYLFLQSQFVFIDFSQSVLGTIMDYLFVSILFMILGYAFTRLTYRKYKQQIPQQSLRFY